MKFIGAEPNKLNNGNP